MFSLMANCFACIKKRQEPPKKVTLVLVGLDNAGKTTAIKGVKGENNTEEPPTVGFSSVEFTFEKKFEVTVYDLGGGKKIRDIWKDYYAEVHGVVFVLDASDEDRIEECRQALKDTLEHHRIHGKRILVLANKQDVDGALDEVDICEQLELEDMVNESKCPCRVETCTAIQGFGKKMDKAIHEGFQWLLHGMAEDWEKLSERVDKEFTEQKEAQRKYKRERLEQIRKQKEEREKREKEERRRNGEEVEESEDEDVIMADPFKKVDDDYFEEKKNKKANKKTKKGDKQVDEEPVKKSKGKSPRLQDEIVESHETERTKNNGTIVMDKPRTKKGKKKSPRGMENNAFEHQDSVNKENKINKNTIKLDSESEAEAEVVVTKKKKKKTNKNLMNDDDEEQLELSKHKDLNVSKSSQFEGSQEDDESNVKKKKKKKKKFKKNNKTAPLAVEGIDEGKAPPGLANAALGPSWANPGGQRNIFIKASKQPTLEPLMEGNAQKLNPISTSNSNSKLEPIKSSLNHNWSLDLPEIPTRRKPNTDDDDDIVV